MRALVVDDNESAAQVLSGFLRRWEFEVEFASNGAEAIQMYLCDPPFSVVLLDLMMPEVSGEDFIKVVESLMQRGRIDKRSHIIIVTTVTQYSYLKGLIGCDCVECALTKPVDHERLREALERCVLKSFASR